MTTYDDFYEPGEYDKQIEELKEALRTSVKQEIRDEIEQLRTDNRDMRLKLKELDHLTLEAKREKRHYELAYERAQAQARAEIKRESAAALLDELTEPMYTVVAETRFGPKCDRCDEERWITYTTPLGRTANERCDCAGKRVTSYHVTECAAWSASHRHGELVVWHVPHRALSTEDPSWQTTVMKNPEGMALEERCREYKNVGYRNIEEAQEVADALNAGEAETE